MADITFSEIGKIEAIRQLYDQSGFKAFDSCSIEASSKSSITSCSATFSEGINFDLTYFPLKHLSHKCVTAVTGDLLAVMAAPRLLNVTFGISGKFNFNHIKELWSGVTAAAREYGYKKVCLDIVPSLNGLFISLSSTGICSQITAKRRSQAHSKDLICISGSLGAAYMGMSLLENEKKSFSSNESSQEKLESYKMIVGAYLKPELNVSVVHTLEEDEIYPSFGYFIKEGLSDAILRLTRDSSLGAKIYADKIPFEGNSFQLGKELNIDPISAAMNGGEDYKLLFVIPILSLEKFRKDFQTFDIIGHLALPEAGAVLVTPEGAELPITSQAWKNRGEEDL